MEEHIEIVFETFLDAERTRQEICNKIMDKGYISYAELYDFVDFDRQLFDDTYSTVGWTDLFGTRLKRFNDKWVLKLPKLEKIEVKKKKEILIDVDKLKEFRNYLNHIINIIEKENK